MILYTTVPQDLIFQEDADCYQKQRVVQLNGVSLLVNGTGENDWTIVRVLSTNPNHYLLESFVPGQKIPYISDCL